MKNKTQLVAICAIPAAITLGVMTWNKVVTMTTLTPRSADNAPRFSTTTTITPAMPLVANPSPGSNQPKSAGEWTRDELLTLLQTAVKTDDWRALIQALARQMRERPLDIIAALIHEPSLKEMGSPLLLMALEHCPSERAHAVACLLIEQCKELGTLAAGMGALLATTARQDADQALALLPFAARTADAAQCLDGLARALVDTRGKQGIAALASKVAGQEHGTALLAGAVARLAAVDARSALQSIDEISNGKASAVSLRCETALAAAPAIIATGNAGHLVKWMQTKSPAMLGADAWSELCLTLASSHPNEARGFAKAIRGMTQEDALTGRLHAIAAGTEQPLVVIDTSISAPTEPAPPPASSEL